MTITRSVTRTTITVGAALWTVAALAFFALEGIAAAAVIPTYSYATNYISALGVPAWSPLADVMNAAFFLQGSLFVIGAVLLVVGIRARKALWFVGFTSANAVGNFLVGAVHTQPVAGSGPGWHFVGAFLAIVGGNAAVLAGSAVIGRAGGSQTYRAVSVALAVLGFSCLVAMWADASQTVLPVGVWQRGSVYPILVWQVFTAVYLVTARPGKER